MRICSRLGCAAGLLAALLLSGCSEEGLTLSPAGAPASRPTAGQGKVPFDLQKIMEQVHFAFRPRGSAWEGEHSTYKVRVDAGGFSLTPFHYPHSNEPLQGEPVRFGVSSVSRGEQVLASRAGPGQVEETGSLTLARGGVAEHFHNSEAGVEQSWSFARKLSGTGALEVRVPVQSGRFLGQTAAGLHFAAGSSGLGVRYGQGTWVDAQGQRTALPARFEAGSMVLSVPAEVVESSSYPAVLAAAVSAEFGMDTPVRGPAMNTQRSAAVAYNGTSFLAVWCDYRSQTGYYDIYGARVTSAGALLDPQGIAISTAAHHKYSPEVASDGVNFLVVWYDSRSGTGNYDIYGARVSSAGAVLEPDGIAISTDARHQYSPAVAYNGTSFLVVWEDFRNGSYDIYGARVSGAGTVLDPSGIPISTAPNNQRAPAVAHDGTNFLVVWEDSRSNSGSSDLYGARVSGSGTVLNTSGILISNAYGNQADPAVAYNGTNFLVVWEDTRNGGSDLYGARVGSTGVVRDPSGIPISTSASDQIAPTVACSGADWLVVWQDFRSSTTSSSDIYGARVSGTGAVLEPSGTPISTATGDQLAPAVASDGTNWLAMWEDSRSGSSDIYGARVSATGAVLDPSGLNLSLSANSQYSPSVAHDGTNFLVVWSDFRSAASAFDIYGVRVSESGTVLDPGGIAISTASEYQGSPMVAHGGTSFLVVWHDQRSGSSYDIYGARVSSTGMVLDTGGIPLSTAPNGQYTPSVSHDGVRFLVVWHDYRNGSNYDVYGTRMDSTGTVLDTSGIAISTAASSQYNPVVAHDGANFLVVWEDVHNGSADIYGARVNGSGVVLDPSGIIISTAARHQYNPAVAHDGVNFLVVWEDYRNGSNHDVYGARVSSTGTVLDTSGIAISTAANDQYNVAVTYNGANFLVVWEDHRRGNGFPDIYGARVEGSGVVRDTGGLAISTGPLSERKPRLTSMGGEGSLVVYHATHLSSTTNSERVMARLVQFP